MRNAQMPSTHHPLDIKASTSGLLWYQLSSVTCTDVVCLLSVALDPSFIPQILVKCLHCTHFPGTLTSPHNPFTLFPCFAQWLQRAAAPPGAQHISQSTRLVKNRPFLD